MKNDRDQLVEENRWVVNDVISKYTHLMHRDELESAGLHGLIEGIDKFKEGKGAKMATYVRHWIKAKVLAAVYENRSVHIPWNKINQHIKDFREQPFEEVSLSGYSYRYANANLKSNYTPKFEISLDSYSTTDDAGDGSNTGRTDNIEIQSSLSSEDVHIMEEVEVKDHVSFALKESALTDLEKKAIRLRFGLNREEPPMTLSKIGALTGLTTMGAQKAIKRGLIKLKGDNLFKDLVN